MTRRLLGPVGGPILFVLVAVLVFGVLGWVTHSALGVERAQREAAARAELGSNLRLALWRLDGRMLPALGVEDSRPFYQYSPADPVVGYGVASTPLLVTNLPDWMKLHFQLDASGWDSPQVLNEDSKARIQLAWPDLPLLNANPERESVLGKLRKHFPAAEALDLFAGRERLVPGDPFSMGAAPGVVDTPEKQANPSPAGIIPAPGELPASPKAPSIQPIGPSELKRDSVHLLGIEICMCRDNGTNNILSSNQLRPPLDESLKKSEQQGLAANRSSRTQAAKDNNNDLGQVSGDPTSRAGTVSRGLKEVQPPPGTGMPKGQGVYGMNSLTNSASNSAYTQSQLQAPAQLNTPGNPNSGMIPTGIVPQTAPSTASAPAANPGVVGSPPQASIVGPLVVATPAVPSKSLDNFSSPTYQNQERLKLDDQGRRNDKEPDRKLAAGPLSEAEKAALRTRTLEKDSSDRFREHKQPEGFLSRSFDLAKRAKVPLGNDAERVANPWVPSPQQAVPGSVPVAQGTETQFIPPAANPAPMAIHLGSMRPQWITAPDGTEFLAIARLAHVDNRPVCQGIILDWPRLEATLRDEVKDLFPDAKLVAVKDPSEASPDRAMSALPVELDPGPQPEPLPAGWTTLRLGLALAWAAAIIAFAAVGFCGWTLIDLAERRIRFVSAVTHELRTPLTSLRLYLDLLVSGMIQDEAKRQEYLNTLTVESDRLHRLIDNVLDFARLEKRRKNGDIKPAKVSELLDLVRQTWADRLAQDGKELVVISTVAEGQEINTDTAVLQQIIGNLVDNARKYSRGAADKRIWVWAKPGASGRVALEVEDRGPGVPASERRSIFKPFRRGEHADNTSGGAGLGLALAKSWAEVLDGKLTYRPADGGTGACFRLEVPATKSQAVTKAQA